MAKQVREVMTPSVQSASPSQPVAEVASREVVTVGPQDDLDRRAGFDGAA
jgi:hypothetical protein